MRILLIESSYFLKNEIRSALIGLGHEVFTEFPEIQKPPSVWAFKLLKNILGNSIEFIISINHGGFDTSGKIGEILEACNLPIATWYIDSPSFIIKSTKSSAPKTMTSFTWEKTAETFLKNSGADKVYYLPLASSPELFSFEKTCKKDNKVIFVGNSLTGAILRTKKNLTSSGQALAEELSKKFLRGDKFHNLINTNIDAPKDNNLWDIWALATWIATAERRHALIKSVDDLYIYGDTNWKTIAPKATYCGVVEYGKDLAKVFSESAVVINSTSLQMPTAVNQRVFDVPLSNSFVLSDNQEDVSQLFDIGNEAITYSDIDDLCSKIKLYKNETIERDRIANNAKIRILKDHTYSNRLPHLLSKTCSLLYNEIDYEPIKKLIGPSEISKKVIST